MFILVKIRAQSDAFRIGCPIIRFVGIYSNTSICFVVVVVSTKVTQLEELGRKETFPQIDEAYMTKESDSPDGNSFLQHQPVWRSDSE